MAEPAIIYLDVDDEITAAASKIRAAEPSHIAIVIPPGSHIATSRINFRLLAREAQTRNRRLSVVAPDAASRSIAGSAGLEVFASVGAFETSLHDADSQAGEAGQVAAAPDAAEPREPSDAALAAAAAASVAAVGPPAKAGARRRKSATPADATPRPDESSAQPIGAEPAAPGAPVPVAPAPVTAASGPKPRQAARAATIVAPAGRRRSRGLLIGVLVIAGLVVAAGIGAAIYLPTATIAVTPRPEQVGPVELTVSSDPAATAVDVEGGVVPATTVTFPVSVSQSFPATGKRTEETRAAGQVTFDSVNTVGPVAVASGSRVSTLGGIVFATTRAVTVPKATVAGTTIKHGTVSVPIRATKAGPEGNVDPGEITQVPDFLSTQQVSANNAKATSGGSRTEFTIVTAKDVDAAKAALQVEATRSFAADVAADEGVPEGQTLFPETATLGPISYDPNPDSLVNDEVETFELTATATGSATAVDVAEVEAIAAQRLTSQVAAGAQLVPDSAQVSIGDPIVTGSVVTFPVTATGSQIRPLDAAALKADVLGLPIDDARAALERYGTVTITVWPDLVTSIPTIDSRVTLTVSDGVTPSASPSSLPS